MVPGQFCQIEAVPPVHHEKIIGGMIGDGHTGCSDGIGDAAGQRSFARTRHGTVDDDGFGKVFFHDLIPISVCLSQGDKMDKDFFSGSF